MADREEANMNEVETQGNGHSSEQTGDKAAAEAEKDPKGEIARLEGEKRDISDRMLRIAADFENYKKRARKEMEDASSRGIESLLKEILPVLDNLDRALTTAGSRGGEGGDAVAGALLDGVRLVQKQFLGTMEKFGVKTFEAQGKPFDPQFHEAVQQVESDDKPPGTVATVFQRGYMVGQRLLRPAMVAVVRGRPSAGPNSETGRDKKEEPAGEEDGQGRTGQGHTQDTARS